MEEYQKKTTKVGEKHNMDGSEKIQRIKMQPLSHKV